MVIHCKNFKKATGTGKSDTKKRHQDLGLGRSLLEGGDLGSFEHRNHGMSAFLSPLDLYGTFYLICTVMSNGQMLASTEKWLPAFHVSLCLQLGYLSRGRFQGLS